MYIISWKFKTFWLASRLFQRSWSQFPFLFSFLRCYFFFVWDEVMGNETFYAHTSGEDETFTSFVVITAFKVDSYGIISHPFHNWFLCIPLDSDTCMLCYYWYPHKFLHSDRGWIGRDYLFLCELKELSMIFHLRKRKITLDSHEKQKMLHYLLPLAHPSSLRSNPSSQ